MDIGVEKDMGLLPVVEMSMEFTDVLTDIERTGLKICSESLEQLRQEYMEESQSLKIDLECIIQDVMGDTPINLDSPDDRSLLFYSRKVMDKKEWKRIFNIGYEFRGNAKKPKRKPNLKPSVFTEHIKRLAPAQRKTMGKQCGSCGGAGKSYFTKKDGTQSANQRSCKPCDGLGVIYTELDQVAGLKMKPRGTEDVNAAGFKTDQTTLESIMSSLSGQAKEFAQKYVRYSKIRTYLNTFVEGIYRGRDENDFIHPQFMQCVTSTGRLSSRNPNFQNMPRGGTFPVRKVVVSRFTDGYILEGDYSQLEFRVAGFLSGDRQIYKDIEDKLDVHSYTAKIIGVSRQEAKAHTFKPLYGGTFGTENEMRYYKNFLVKYSGVEKWHRKLQESAVVEKKITLPSGREYSFPYAKFTKYGNVTGATAIKNYPVQGFATADLLPLALINLKKRLDSSDLKCKIVNTVHDSIVLDVPKDEKEQAINLLRESMLSLKHECKERFNINLDMPIEVELKIGTNWLDLEGVLI